MTVNTNPTFKCLCCGNVVREDLFPGNHDDHYAAMNVEPFDVMEDRMLEPSEDGPGHPQRLALAIAIKHIMRAGLKPGQPWRKDIEKAINYLNRALTGEWLRGDKTRGD